MICPTPHLSIMFLLAQLHLIKEEFPGAPVNVEKVTLSIERLQEFINDLMNHLEPLNYSKTFSGSVIKDFGILCKMKNELVSFGNEFDYLEEETINDIFQLKRKS